MKNYKIENFKKGWFIGNFSPVILKTNEFEVAFKSYKKDTYEKKHFHKISSEYTLISEGCALMNGKKYIKGDIVLIEPGDVTDFLALTDCSTLVVKVPSSENDKYLVND